MDTRGSEGKRRYNEELVGEEEEEEEEDVNDERGFGEDGRRKRVITTADLYRNNSSSSSSSSKLRGSNSMPPPCQVDNCDADLSEAKPYHRRHKVCEYHAKAPAVHIAGLQQRFCQQCSRFHELSEFDDTKRSCRRRLAGHNERRRKHAIDYHGE